MSDIPLSSLHPDFGMTAPVVAALYRQAGGAESFAVVVPEIFRRAIDEVIDAPRTNRFTIDQLEKTEKTYLGTKIEILLRNALKLPKGKILDLSVDGIEVDIKNTTRRAWTIPTESYNHLALLLRSNERKALCDVGVAVIRPEYLNHSENKDKKRTLSKEGAQNIWWLLYNHPYPVNFWERLPRETRLKIFAAGTANARIASLFTELQRVPISRQQIEAIAQQDDPMRRIRRNGGARDLLIKTGIAILSGRNHANLLVALGFTHVLPDEFLSLRPESAIERELLHHANELS